MYAAGKILLGALGVIAIVRLLWRKRSVPGMPTADEQKQVLEPVRYGCFEHKGNRSNMEDFHFATTEHQRGFFTVCDGHGGQDAARFTTETLFRHFLTGPSLLQSVGSALEAAFLKVDQLFHKEVAAGRQQPSGTTALAAVVLPQVVVVANAGDCRCILSRSGTAVDVTEEHSPQSPKEKIRIHAAGGFLDEDGYLCGQLGVSRAIGDHHLEDLKSPGGSGPLIADPEVTEVAIGDDDEFMVLASDGLWMTSQAVVNLVRSSLRSHDCPMLAAEKVATVAMNDPTSKDNITVIVICFKKVPPPRRPAGANKNSRLRINRN